jgi:predicted nucleic acid-binding protein
MIPTPGNKYLFDTTVFLDAIRRRPVARQIMFEARDQQITVGYSILTEAELWAGITGMRTAQEHEILLKPFKRYFLNVTIACRAGQLWASIARTKPDTIPDIADCIIAATAEYYAMGVCTRNKNHFSLLEQFSNHSFPLTLYSA